jgi:uncharacterized protein YjdB
MSKVCKSLPWLLIPALLLIVSCVNPAASVVPVAGISFDDDENPTLLNVGDTKSLAVVFSPLNATDKGLSWTSLDSDIAEVDNEGNVTGMSEGYTAIIATSDDGDYEAECGITVCAYPVREVSLNVNNLSLTVGELYQFVATVLPAYATDKSVTWASSNEAVVKPVKNGDGKIFAIGVGTATVTATTTDGGKTAHCSVTVAP